MGSFALCECSAFAGFVEAYSVNSVTFTFRTVCVDFFRNVHVNHDQLPIRETHSFLYFMTYKPKSNADYIVGSAFWVICSQSLFLKAIRTTTKATIAIIATATRYELIPLLFPGFAVLKTLVSIIE